MQNIEQDAQEHYIINSLDGTKKKIGAWSKGKTYEELLGKEKSLLLKEKRKNSKLNKKLSQETKNKISAAHLKRNNNE